MPNWSYAAPTLTSNKVYILKSKATDEATNTETPGDGISFTFDTTFPSSLISVPTNNSLFKTTFTYTGTASDVSPGQVTNTQVLIKNITQTKYWTSNDLWESGVEWLTTGGTPISWSYSNGLLDYTSGDKYVIQTRAGDDSGNVETVGEGSTFIYDTTSPSSVVIYPSNNSALTGLTVISGTSTDLPAINNAGLLNVKISIKKSSDTTYWTGGIWTSTEFWSCSNIRHEFLAVYRCSSMG